MKSINNIIELSNLLAMAATLGLSFYAQKNKELSLIGKYITVSLFLNIWLKIADYLPQNIVYQNITGLSTNIYSVVEFSLIYLFLFRLITAAKFHTLLKIFYALFISISFAIWIGYKGSIFGNISPLYGLENILITTACFLYLFEILKSEEIIDFKSDPKFISVCGILFYFSITIPFFFS